jgi:hypothetical protein
MNRKLLTAGLVLALTMGMTGAALAATSDTSEASATISAGSLSILVGLNDIAFSTTLDGTDQVLTDEDITGWAAEDATGSGSGWHVNVSGEDFSDGGTNTIAVANFKIKLLDTDISVVAGNTKPSSSITSYTALDPTPAALMSASADTGMGEYNFAPDFQLSVPAETYAASYDSTVTLEIVSGP